jgi:hypothetical protein
MLVGVYGIGYAIAAFDPWRHWPIVLVGLLGKLLGPIGLAQAVAEGTLPLAFGWSTTARWTAISGCAARVAAMRSAGVG